MKDGLRLRLGLRLGLFCFTILNSLFTIQLAAQPAREAGFFLPRAPGQATNDTYGLAAWWTMDDSSGTDSSGNGNGLTWNGSPTFPAGLITNAVDLTGSPQYRFHLRRGWRDGRIDGHGVDPIHQRGGGHGHRQATTFTFSASLADRGL